MQDQSNIASDGNQVVAALVELVEALDRRVPHVERAGEDQVVAMAAALRKAAMARIEEITAR